MATITWGSCGHPLYDRVVRGVRVVRCRVCRRNPGVDRNANPLGEARLAHFDDPLERIDDGRASSMEWFAQEGQWRARLDEANACDGPAAPMTFGHLDEVGVPFFNFAGYRRFLLQNGTMRLNPNRMTADFVEVPPIAFTFEPLPILRDDHDVETGKPAAGAMLGLVWDAFRQAWTPPITIESLTRTLTRTLNETAVKAFAELVDTTSPLVSALPSRAKRKKRKRLRS